MKTGNESILAAGELEDKLMEAEGGGDCRSGRLWRECSISTDTGYLDSAITSSQVTFARAAFVEKREECGCLGIHTLFLRFSMV